MDQSINFFTPVLFDKFNNQLGHTLLEACDTLFSFDGNKAVVISVISENDYSVKLDQAKPAFLETALKIVCLMTVVIPVVAIIGKLILRCIYGFKIQTIESSIGINNRAESPETSTTPSPLPTRDLDEDEIRELYSQAIKGNLDQVGRLLALGKISQEDRERIVLEAAKFGHLNVIKKLLRNGAVISEEARGEVVKEAAKRVLWDVVKELIKDGAVISEEARGEVVKEAAKKVLWDVVKELIKDGAIISEEARGEVVKEAAKNNRLDIVKELLKNGAVISEEARGEAVRYATFFCGSLAIVQELLQGGAAISKDNRVLAVLGAIEKKYLEILKELLKGRADFSEEDWVDIVVKLVLACDLNMLKEICNGGEIPVKCITSGISLARKQRYGDIEDFLSRIN